jgi:glucokinase
MDSKMSECMLALDVGGTSIKFALLGRSGRPLNGTTGQMDFRSDGTSTEILDAFLQAASSGVHMAKDAGYAISGCGIAFPGPFDYELGISRMTHKMQAIAGIPLTPVLREVLGDMQVCYLHDSTAYLIGEAACGAAANAVSPSCVMLGTGLGFAYMKNGRVRVGYDQRPHTILWNAPFKAGIVEDYVSRRAIRERFAKNAGVDAPPDVKEIAALAYKGNTAALHTFHETGELLADILRPVLSSLDSDLLVIGGQIARSAELFIHTVETGLHIPVRAAEHLDDAALIGAARYCALHKEACVEEAQR